MTCEVCGSQIGIEKTGGTKLCLDCQVDALAFADAHGYYPCAECLRLDALCRGCSQPRPKEDDMTPKEIHAAALDAESKAKAAEAERVRLQLLDVHREEGER